MNDIVQVLIQGGAVGIALVALWITYKITSNHLNHVSSALDRNTDVTAKLDKTITKLSSVIDKKLK